MNSFSCSEKPTIYKKSLGATITYNIYGNVNHVYDVYEDFDGSIKYYDFPYKWKKVKGNYH